MCNNAMKIVPFTMPVIKTQQKQMNEVQKRKCIKLRFYRTS